MSLASFRKQDSLCLVSPAKVNLFFHLLFKRDDGYHEIFSLLQAVSLYDDISIKKAEFDLFRCSNPSLENTDNLVYKALDLFRKKTGIFDPVEIYLHKNIPLQAGLGGGSSNAATTLYGLNKLFSTPLSEKELREIASEIGSDVPFFFSSGTALCMGRGEKVEDFRISDPLQAMIVHPSFGLGTKQVFGKVDFSFIPKRDPALVRNSLDKGDFFLGNDLQGAAFDLNPQMRDIFDSLQGISDTVFMTGSGSSFVCVSLKIASTLLPSCQYFPVKGVKRKGGFWYELEV